MGNNDAKEMLAVCKKEAVKIEAELKHLREVAELHEIATENAARYAAVIADARLALEGSSGPSVEEAALEILATADTDAVLRERDAEKWDEGARAGWDACFAWESGKAEHSQPVNPYREGD